jgi:dipeptidyl aminopeptidase/acylaminoacyl peptidase
MFVLANNKMRTMKKLSTLFVVASLCVSLNACMSTASTTTNPNLNYVTTPVVPATPPSSTHSNESGQITLEKIMSDPDWMGRQPLSPHWSIDSSTIVYKQKREGSVVKDSFMVDPDQKTNAKLIDLSQLHRYEYDEMVISPQGQYRAWRFKDSLFVRLASGENVQLTQGGETLSHLSFVDEHLLIGQTKNAIIAIDLTTGQRHQLLSWAFADEPVVNQPAKDFIAQEQQSLIEYIAKRRAQKEQQEEAKTALANASIAVAPAPFYFDKEDKLVRVSVSPNGAYALVVTTKKTPSRDKSDIMPHYIQEDGRIKAVNARRRVNDAKAQGDNLWLLDLKAGTKHALSYVNLPGYNDDVLAQVKLENAEARGETYQINRLPRTIGLLSSHSVSPLVWHQSGEQVAIMLAAKDNKDRWLVTVDLAKHQLIPQHRLHDDAWVSGYFSNYNSFGWLHNSETLYYLSEESGYGHLYTKLLSQKAVQHTSGQYVVYHPTVTKDDHFIYYTANKKHPGIYEVYRLNLITGEDEALTDLNGLTTYQLSPDEKRLLLTHSTVTRPPELYVKDVTSEAQPTQLTHTVSDEFLAMPWTAPQVVAVPSSHTEQPIYSRVYLPQDYAQGKPRKAVVFNHGAGYLQNAHLGWSLYFREFMFHSLLVQQGYVVIDMDYRASEGYGRDWRTAIYRNMGEPEVQDLRDGVNWLVANANVDRQRIGTYGGSYGGFLTYMSLFTAPDLFQAGAALRPVSDWAHYNTTYTSNILNTPDIDPIAYRRSSPIYYAEGLQKPLLINAPMVDSNVFFQDVVRLTQRLIELKKENFETAIYPVESHGFVQPTSWLDEYRRIYKLFETNL